MQINLSIDDISPHPRSSTKCLYRCFELIKDFPSIKFTLFIPTAYTRINELSYDIRNFPDFVKEINSLPKTIFEIGYHGHFHGVPGEFNRGEFTFLDYKTSLDRLLLLRKLFNTCKLNVSPIFRPPGFSLTPGGFIACKEIGIKVLSLYPESPYRLTYLGEENNFDRVVFMNCYPRVDFPDIKKINTLSIMYHACEWDKNYFSELRKKELNVFLKDNTPNFCFLEEL